MDAARHADKKGASLLALPVISGLIFAYEGQGTGLQNKNRCVTGMEGFFMVDTFGAALGALLADVAHFVPLFLLFLIILIVGLFVARAIAKALTKVLRKVGFDRAVERGGVKSALARSSLDASELVSKIIYYALVLFVLQFAFGVFGPNSISVLLAAIIAFLPLVVVAIIIIVITAAVAAAVKTLIQGSLGGLSYGRTLANVASIFILGIGIIAALNQVGIATTVTTPILIAVLAAIVGILIVGVGGGLIRPMSERWERYLNRAEEEAPRIKAQAQAAPPATEQIKDAAQQFMPPTDGEQGGSHRY